MVLQVRLPNMPMQLHFNPFRNGMSSPQRVELHRIAQGLESAGVHVGCGFFYVAQCWYLEPALEPRRIEGSFSPDVYGHALGLGRAYHRDLLVGKKWRLVTLGTTGNE